MGDRVGHLLSAKLECQEAGATPLAQFLSRKIATDMALNKKLVNVPQLVIQIWL